MINKSRKNNNGFTLVEVIVAAAIVAIVSAMIVTAFLTAANLKDKATDAKNQDRELDFDIYTSSDAAASTTSIILRPKQNGDPIVVGGNEVSIPLNVKTFTSGNREILIFRK